MKSSISLLLFLLGICLSVQAQDDTRFTVEVSTDSILFGNYFKVTFTLENAKGGEFSAPDFSEFHVVSGPNRASSMSIINGEVTQSISYSYYLEPKDIGNFYIAPAGIDLGDRILETQAVEILVVPNPEGIKQSPESGIRRDDFNIDGFNSFGDGFPDLDRINELFRQMAPDGDMEGFQLFRDSLPSFNLDEFFRMMPEMRMDIPEQLQPNEEQPKDTSKKKKRKVYKI